jgi:homoserine dehydrogenase
MADVEIQNLIPEPLRDIAHFHDFKAQFSVLDEHYGRLKASLDASEVLRFVGDMQLSASGMAALTVSLIKVPKGSPLGGVQRSDSLFEIFTEGYGDHPFVIQGAGAGAEVTARGVYSDILRLG